MKTLTFSVALLALAASASAQPRVEWRNLLTFGTFDLGLDCPRAHTVTPDIWIPLDNHTVIFRGTWGNGLAGDAITDGVTIRQLTDEPIFDQPTDAVIRSIINARTLDDGRILAQAYLRKPEGVPPIYPQMLLGRPGNWSSFASPPEETLSAIRPDDGWSLFFDSPCSIAGPMGGPYTPLVSIAQAPIGFPPTDYVTQPGFSFAENAFPQGVQLRVGLSQSGSYLAWVDGEGIHIPRSTTGVPLRTATLCGFLPSGDQVFTVGANEPPGGVWIARNDQLAEPLLLLNQPIPTMEDRTASRVESVITNTRGDIAVWVVAAGSPARQTILLYHNGVWRRAFTTGDRAVGIPGEPTIDVVRQSSEYSCFQLSERGDIAYISNGIYLYHPRAGRVALTRIQFPFNPDSGVNAVAGTSMQQSAGPGAQSNYVGNACLARWFLQPDGTLVHGSLTFTPPTSYVCFAARIDLSCPADFNADRFVDFFDVAAFIDCFEGVACPPGGVSADFTDDGFIDFFDLDAFLAAFEAGCPD